MVITVSTMSFIFLLLRFVLQCSLKKLEKDTKNVAFSKNRVVKSIIDKYKTSTELKTGVNNVELFVKKNFRKYRIWGVKIEMWENFSNVCSVIVMSTSMTMGFFSLMRKMENSQVFMPVLIGIVGASVLLFLDYIWNVETIKQNIMIDLMEYLENICRTKEIYAEEIATAEKVDKVEEKSLESAFAIEFTPEEEKVIREVINEYL